MDGALPGIFPALVEEVLMEREYSPKTYIRLAYMDIAYTLGQFTDQELHDAGLTPKLKEAMNQYIVAYIVASIDHDPEGDHEK